MNEEIKEFIEFRTDEDGTYFYYNDKDNTEQWSYKLDDLKEYITNLQQENARLKDKIEKATNFVDKYMDEWDFQDEVWKDMNDLLILLKEN